MNLQLKSPGRGRFMRELSSYDPRDFQGAYYYERCLLSCLLAGAAIPAGITAETLLIPRHKVIFEAIRELAGMGIRGNIGAVVTWLDKIGLLEKAGGEDYVWEVESVIGIPSAVTAFAVEVRRLALARI